MYSAIDLDTYADAAIATGASTMFGAIAGFFAAYAVFAIAIIVINIIANWKLFTKAGKPGWASIVPVYNVIVQFQIIGLSPWLLLLCLVPVVNFVALPVLAIMIPFRLAKSYGKGTGWGFGLLFLSFIFYLVLAFGPSEYVGPNGNA